MFKLTVVKLPYLEDLERLRKLRVLKEMLLKGKDVFHSMRIGNDKPWTLLDVFKPIMNVCI